MPNVPLGRLGIDPSTPGFSLRPDYFDVLARLRAEAPVYEYRPGIKAVSRYDDIREISRDPVRFCSSRGALVNDPIREGGSIEGSILHMDPPEHSAWRAVLNREFTVRAVNRMEDRVRAITGDLLDAIPREEVVDLVEILTARIPVLVICELLGVPDADRAHFRRWSDATIVASDGRAAMSESDAEAVAEMIGYLTDLAEKKLADPAADIISLLVTSDIDGKRLDPGELLTFIMSLVVAGNETTRHLMSGSMIELAARPDQRAVLHSTPEVIPRAVEECLRWITPIQQFARTVTEDTDLSGHALAEGDYVVMLYASGNRDEVAFGPTADVFDITRDPPTPNLAFGFGEHFCLGAALARLEERVLLEALAAREAAYEQAGDATYLPSSLVRGPDRAPFVFS
ncbi:MAG: cytochrome P450 [Acidimicrobiia bacterium]